jgi:spore maturation protein SpmA
MASAAPQAIRRSGGMNRWILEPLFYPFCILFLTTTILVIRLAAGGQDAVLVAVTVIVSAVAAAVVWSRALAARRAR